jgi:acyl carrier protein
VKINDSMEQQQLFQIVQDSMDSLFKSELIPGKIVITNETILLGRGSGIDSVAFITLFSEIEDRLSERSGKEVFIDFNELHNFNTEKSYLNAGTLIDYISSLLKTA